MSELKSETIYFTHENGEAYAVDMYIKSEADKVIADKDAEIAQLQAMLEERNKQVGELKHSLELASNECCSISERSVKRLRHHKYKRCLDKAEMCKARYDEEDAKVNGHYSSWEYISEEMKYWERWQRRWLELAEKFKPNSTHQQKD